ncbi:MAG: glycosyltransferase family 4 protein [Anaerolineae bacterium]|nr:glycosyltransferase family 4 protein [Anaerolineae bacterium]
MKIQFATIFYPPTHIGGTEIYTHALARALQKAGHQVRVLCAENWGQGKAYWNGHIDEIYENVPVRRLALNWTQAQDVNRQLYDNPVIAKRVQGYLEEWQPDIVHVTSCQTLSTSIITTAKQLGFPVVVTLADYWFICPRVTLVRSDGENCDGRVQAHECSECMLGGTKIYSLSHALLPPTVHQKFLTGLSRQWWLARRRGLRGMALDIKDRREMLHHALNQADYCIVPSAHVKRAFELNDFNVPIQITPLGDDLGWLSAYQGKTRSEKTRFGYLGQILPFKGVDVIVRAFLALPPELPAELYIYGPLRQNDPYVAELQQMAAGHSNIHFKGPYKRSELAEVLANFDVFVFGSTWNEPYGLVIHEAFATQTPVIASNVGAIPESVQDEINGLLYRGGDSTDLSRQMRRIIEQEGLLSRLRDNIQPVWTMDREVVKLVKIYERAQKSKAATGPVNTAFAEKPV